MRLFFLRPDLRLLSVSHLSVNAITPYELEFYSVLMDVFEFGGFSAFLMVRIDLPELVFFLYSRGHLINI